MKWEEVLRNKDKETAKEIMFKKLEILGKKTNDVPSLWKEFCNYIEFPYESSYDNDKNLTSRFRRVLVELKFLALTGNHNFPF